MFCQAKGLEFIQYPTTPETNLIPSSFGAFISSTICEMKNMKPLKQENIQRVKNPIRINWVDYISDENQRLAIPVGPRFQADLPALTVSPCKNDPFDDNDNSDSTKWLGVKVWPGEGKSRETGRDLIGKGRPEICQCSCPGSVQCVKRHTTAKKIQLQSDLGPAFWKWKFDNMGDDVSKLWNLEEQKKFENIVKLNATSYGQIFIKSALDNLPCQSREDIISYYLNVHVPRRMSAQIRSGCTTVDTDDESEQSPSMKGSRKRLQANPVASNNCKYEKTQYLTGRR